MPASLGSRTFLGQPGLHPDVIRRLDGIFKSLSNQDTAIAAVKAGAVTPAQSRAIANQAVASVLASQNQQNNQNTGAPVTILFTDGPLNPIGGTFVIAKAGVFAATLVAPQTANGAFLRVSSSGNFSHTITTANLLLAGAAGNSVATFPPHAGAGLTLMAFNGVWLVQAIVGAVVFM